MDRETETPQTRDPELTRSRILAAATELFVDKGFADVAMREIAERSQVTKSLIHHHFGSKEQLWDAVKTASFESYARAQKAALEEASEANRDLLISSVTAYFQFLKDHPDCVRLYAWTHLEGDTESGHRMDRELVALGARRVAEAQQRGLLRGDVNPTHVVALFVHACTHWFEARSHHADWPGIGSDEEYLEDFLKVFMEGLLSREPEN